MRNHQGMFVCYARQRLRGSFHILTLILLGHWLPAAQQCVASKGDYYSHRISLPASLPGLL